MSTILPPFAHPGLELGPISKYTPGPGTHVHDGHIHASLSGAPILNKSTKPPTISIPQLLPPLSNSNLPSTNVTNRNTLPSVGSIVLGKIIRCMVRQVNVAILVVDERVCADEWSGVVRREDVRATEKEKLVVGESFRVGDLIRGEVISLGDQTNYYLTTARNELGVIMAKSEAGNTMHPISWKEFKDPITGETEARKVAKPF
ncbi:MAG: exosome 3'-_5 exonuclease subunit ski4 (Csl4) [Heterodermia speciosa]|uniref:Exosome 3'->5 exonuclease subunit ski4 (Csl4) n=1 Tax=Heterodermia speciosa TaxID=116794 RepID=A0A8H3I1X4_9LECA|nr:MAG: exosome 3'->5 exonuclease subunit ski4 (Csl4) [Heterodermia speciosa]